MLGFLPAQLAASLRFLIAGPGSDAAELSRFFDLHVVVLPAVLISLVAWKMYMFEIHGAAKPAAGVRGTVRDVAWFPNILLFFTLVSAVFLTLIIGISAVFPLTLPAQFTPEAAATFVPQPEWYFLWIYQILKVSVFEGSLAVIPLVGITLAFTVLLVLPFIDRSEERNPVRRRLYVTLGLIVFFELITLSAWGYLTPGQVVPISQAVVVVGGIALSIGFMSFLTYRARKMMRLSSSE
jgi:ubiquinol-cytochrome c reductase cytochrome b subunit